MLINALVSISESVGMLLCAWTLGGFFYPLILRFYVVHILTCITVTARFFIIWLLVCLIIHNSHWSWRFHFDFLKHVCLKWFAFQQKLQMTSIALHFEDLWAHVWNWFRPVALFFFLLSFLKSSYFSFWILCFWRWLPQGTRKFVSILAEYFSASSIDRSSSVTASMLVYFSGSLKTLFLNWVNCQCDVNCERIRYLVSNQNTLQTPGAMFDYKKRVHVPNQQR